MNIYLKDVRLNKNIRKELKGQWSSESLCCVICGTTFKSHDEENMCGYCHEKAAVDTLNFIEYKTGKFYRPKLRRVKFNLPKRVIDKRKWLSEVFNCTQGEIDEMAINVLFDIITGLVGKSDITPAGLFEVIAKVRLSIINAGINVQKEKVTSIFAEEINEVALEQVKGAQIGGRLYGLKSKT